MVSSKVVRAIEEKEGRPISDVLIDLFDKHGSQTAVAAKLGVNQSTVSEWLLKLGLEQRTVLVKRNGGAV